MRSWNQNVTPLNSSFLLGYYSCSHLFSSCFPVLCPVLPPSPQHRVRNTLVHPVLKPAKILYARTERDAASDVWHPSKSQTFKRQWYPVESSANLVICLWQLLHYCLQMKYQPLCPIKLNLQPLLLGAKCIDCYINHQSARPFSDYLPVCGFAGVWSG